MGGDEEDIATNYSKNLEFKNNFNEEREKEYEDCEVNGLSVLDSKRRRVDNTKDNGNLSVHSPRDEIMLDSSKMGSNQKNLLPAGPVKVTRQAP